MALTKVRRGGTDTGISDSSDATAITIDSSERVGIGETTPLANLHIKSADSGVTPSADSDELFIEGSGNSGITIGSGSSSSGTIRFADSGTDNRGNITFNHSNEAMTFTTAASERMRIDSSGRVLIGTTSTLVDGDQFLQVSASQACNMRATVSSADGGSVLNLERSANSQGDFLRLFNSSGSETGQIRVDSGGTTQFENVSDYRLKENIKDWAVDASAKVKQVKIKTFDWKDQTAQTNGKGLVGVIAHELQEVYPYCVSGKKDGYGADVDKDGNKKPMYQGVDYGKLTPLLTKALQEALDRIDTLEAKVTALESK